MSDDIITAPTDDEFDYVNNAGVFWGPLTVSFTVPESVALRLHHKHQDPTEVKAYRLLLELRSAVQSYLDARLAYIRACEATGNFEDPVIIAAKATYDDARVVLIEMAEPR